MKSYFGIAHVKILPPKNVYIPVIINGKLTFPLCTACAQSQEVLLQCNHTESERAIDGVYCTPEIMAAIEKGYKILKIYEVYHYPYTSQYDPETDQ